MAYSRSPPRSPASPDDWESRISKPSSKTYSTTSSNSTGLQSRSQSVASSSASSRAQSSSSTNIAAYESAARTYYVELKKFLVAELSAEAINGPNPQRVSARQKLSRLNNLQFHELAMDVYDELMRRNLNDNKVPFLPVRDEFHPRRNQARQKLATLPTPRFKDLAMDVYHEIHRRYPKARDDEDNKPPPVPPVRRMYNNEPQASQSTNIVPIKGTVNVEAIDLSDDEKGYMNDQRNKTGSDGNFQSLDSLMADLGNMVSSGSKTATGESKDAWRHDGGDAMEKMRADYEQRLATMTKRYQQLEAELMAARERKPSLASDDSEVAKLRKMDQSRLKQLQEEYNRLDDRYQQLEREHRSQQDVIDEVKEETAHLLEQVKILSAKNDELRAEKEQADERIRQLTEQVKEWQEKYEKSRLELRTLKAMSLTGEVPKQDIIRSNGFIQPTKDGVISHDHVIEYQRAIDNLLQTARSTKLSEVLVTMQSIVKTCKLISESIEAHESKVELSSSVQTNLYGLKSQFSTALSNLLTAAKTHANGMGISPVSLLDAAASNLTTVVVDLVKLLGMRPGQTTNMETTPMTNGSSGGENSSLEPHELADYLKTETDHIVQTIQNLLSALRTPGQSGQVYGIITSITDIVTSIMEACENTFASSRQGYRYKNQARLVLSDLERCKDTLTHIRDTSFDRSPDTASANAKRDLAKEAYEVAKYTKELITIFDG